jgi:hypothetical protein
LGRLSAVLHPQVRLKAANSDHEQGVENLIAGELDHAFSRTVFAGLPHVCVRQFELFVLGCAEQDALE